MLCVYCSGDTNVVNSRHQKRLNRVWRRRTCISCNSTFSTTEVIQLDNSIRIEKNGRLKPFERDTLLLSIYDSLRHRKSALSDATALTDTIISKLYPLMNDAVIDRGDVVRQSIEVLRRFDTAAATSYSAFHIVK